MSDDTSIATIPFNSDSLTLSNDERAKYEFLANLMAGRKEGFEEMAREWRPALLKIVQPVTTDAAKPVNAKNGDMFHKGGGVKLPLKVVLAYAWTSRVRFVQGEDKRPSCASENVDTVRRGAQDQSVSVYGDSCAKCPFGDQPFSRGSLTNCNNVLNVILIPETLDNVYQYSFSRSSYNIGRQFTDLAMATPFAWSRYYELTTEAKKRDKGSGLYYVPTITPSEVQPPEHLKAFAQYVNRRMSELRQVEKKAIRSRQKDINESAGDVAVPTKGNPGYTDAI